MQLGDKNRIKAVAILKRKARQMIERLDAGTLDTAMVLFADEEDGMVDGAFMDLGPRDNFCGRVIAKAYARIRRHGRLKKMTAREALEAYSEHGDLHVFHVLSVIREAIAAEFGDDSIFAALDKQDPRIKKMAAWHGSLICAVVDQAHAPPACCDSCREQWEALIKMAGILPREQFRDMREELGAALEMVQ